MEVHHFSHLILTIFLIFYEGQVSTGQQDEGGGSSKSMLGFCENEHYSPHSKEACDGGLFFGRRSPKCVCIKGIYRMYLSNCEVADGFAEEVCTLIEDVETGVKVKGVKLTKEHDFNEVAVVYERLTIKESEWTILGSGERSKLTGKIFYTITGQAFISGGRGKRRKICVSKTPSQKTGRICLHRHTDNVDHWPIVTGSTKNLEIIVRDLPCDDDGHEEWIQLRPFRCFEPLNLFDSDCQLPCDKSSLMGPKRNKGLTKVGQPNLDQNCTDPHAFLDHENGFLDRRLIHYLLMKALGRPNVGVDPSETGRAGTNNKEVYDLFDLVKNIAMASCTHKSLPVSFMQKASRLFLYLLRGNQWNFEIKIDQRDYHWIKSILEKCHQNLTTLVLNREDMDKPQHECSNDPKANGYCVYDRPSCDHTPVTLSSKYSDFVKKHYVPETVWLFMDIVHMNCFADFEESYRMFHVLEQTIEKMFITPIRDLWHNPVWSDTRKVSIMGSGVEDVMWNMEICAESVYHHHNHTLHRLRRPDPFHYHSRKKRNADHLSQNFDVFCARNAKDFLMPEGCLVPKISKAIIKPKVIFS